MLVKLYRHDDGRRKHIQDFEVDDTNAIDVINNSHSKDTEHYKFEVFIDSETMIETIFSLNPCLFDRI